MAKTYNVRITSEAYEILRKLSFDARKPMLQIIDEALATYTEK